MPGINPYTVDQDIEPDPGDHPLAGNHNDDDGQAIDDQFRASAWGPVVSEGVAYEQENIAKPTRLITNRVPVGTVNGVLFDPVMLFPADLQRKNLKISATNNATVFVADNRNVVMTPSSACAFTGGSGDLTLDGHTGPVWVYSTDGNPVTVQGVAVSM